MSQPASSCPHCSAPLRASDEVCPFCGYSLTERERGEDVFPSPRPPPRAAPAAAVEAAASPTFSSVATTPVPWERRRELGFFRAVWLTWRDSVFRPVPFFRRLPPRAGYGSPLGYAVLVTALGVFFSFYWGTMEEALGGALDGPLFVELITGFVTVLIGLAVMLPLYAGLLFASVAIIHVGFLVAGAGRRGYEATFRAVSYASGPVAFSIFPFFGPLIGLVWGMVLIYIAVREVQRTTNGRATLGFLIPLFAALALLLLLILLLALAMNALGIDPAA